MPTLVRNRRSSIEEPNQRELLFIKNLLASEVWDPSEAARKTGSKNPRRYANETLKKPHIQKLLGREQRRRLSRLDMDGDEVLRSLSKGLFTNFAKYLKETDPADIPDEIGMLLEGSKKTRSYLNSDGEMQTEEVIELKLPSKTKLLDMAMKHCGLVEPSTSPGDTNVNVNVGIGGSLAEVVAQVEETRKSQVIDGRVIEEEQEHDS